MDVKIRYVLHNAYGTGGTIRTVFNADNGCTKVPATSGAFSLGVGKGFKAYHFDITSTGTSSRSATQTHVQSFYVVAQEAGCTPAPVP